MTSTSNESEIVDDNGTLGIELSRSDKFMLVLRGYRIKTFQRLYHYIYR